MSKGLTEKQFKTISEFINQQFGIKLPPEKKIMLESRLQKRLNATKLPDFEAYIEHVFSKKGKNDELVNMVDEVTTNKTEFFREIAHFNLLNSTVLPLFASSSMRKVNIWSAACSSGEEVYTLAMTMSEFIHKNPGMDYHIHGSDVSYRILKKAVNAIYQKSRMTGVSAANLSRYFLKSKQPGSDEVRIKPELRNKTSFSYLNFMDPVYKFTTPFDIIFCRNALIYFEKHTQENVIRKLIQNLVPGGFLFLGHSESIVDFKLPLEQVAAAVYQKTK